MWDHAEAAGLLDAQGVVRLISRNEEEAPVHHIMGRRVVDILLEESHPVFEAAFQEALRGNESFTFLAARADAGYRVWARVRMLPSPVADSPVMFHFRRLPRKWEQLSEREREVVVALHDANLNPKRAASQLGISQHTLNAHRRAICQKCDLRSVGDFWIFIERCR